MGKVFFQISAQSNALPRRGASIILVLGLLAIAMAVSYAMIRTQMTTAQIQGNLGRRDQAHQAAITGVNMALRRMHDADWPGVDTSTKVSLSSQQWYEVSYLTGDPSLRSGDANYTEYPYRVTIISDGYAADPANPSIRSVHRIQAVVQLAWRTFSAEPATWNNLQQYTIHQWADKDTIIQLPVHIDGPVHLQGKIRLCESYPNNSNVHSEYLASLEDLYTQGMGDSRPLAGPLETPTNRTPSSTLALIASELGVTVNDVPGTNTAPLSHPGSVSQYQLYPGGKVYSVPTLQSDYGSNLTNMKLSPDPLTNPLGVYFSQGALNLYDNVTLQGTIITSGIGSSIHVYGDNVKLSAANLPALEGASGTAELPAVIIQDNFEIHSQASGSLTGLAMIGKKWELRRGSADVAFELSGRLLTKKLHLHGRPTWDIGESNWVDLLNSFNDQLGDPMIVSPVTNFADWVELQQGLVTGPLLTFGPQSGAVTYHWQDWNEPIYASHPDDEGLRWDLIEWTDNP